MLVVVSLPLLDSLAEILDEASLFELVSSVILLFDVLGVSEDVVGLLVLGLFELLFSTFTLSPTSFETSTIFFTSSSEGALSL